MQLPWNGAGLFNVNYFCTLYVVRPATCAYPGFWKAPPANSTPTSLARTIHARYSQGITFQRVIVQE